MKMKTNRKGMIWSSIALMSALLAGCGGGDASSETAFQPANTTPPPLQADLASADAGVPVTLPAPSGLTDYQTVAQNKNFGRRRDPFALLGPEATFERQQQRERFFSDSGGFFGSEFELPDPAADLPPQVEPQPFRRLAGILVGDGITALIQMEDGVIYDVRPGNRIGASPWVVVSIDNEKLVMRRDGNVLPREVTVRIEEDITRNVGGATGGGGTGTAQGGGGTSQQGSGGSSTVGAADR